ncbi:HpcH/HpaI aldolase/citrate lyase family protein [Actinomadura sp. WMMA1423]|uniref:HpcH/HpaI aldolase family protein n=1 Tax=Actinomadura sp. WMMA1423 TaxID=2591108 RepID=UPI00197A83DC|nr:aldolase/citrate lyase family protein [Actinomadura sp. WMMA1423]
MKHTPEPLAGRIARGDVVIGLIVKMPAAAVIELAGHAGFDLVVIDTEHGAAEVTELEHHLRAADAAGIAALVRVGDHEPLPVLRALDAGAAGIIVPHISCAEEAQAAVRAAHYPPAGVRGLAISTRAGRQGTVPVERHLADAAEQTIVVAQIEDKKAVDRSDDIAKTERLNAVWIGPSDLSLSLGVPGQLDHPDVTAAVNQIAADVIASPDCALCVLVDTVEQAAQWRVRGAGILLFNSTALIARELQSIAASTR